MKDATWLSTDTISEVKHLLINADVCKEDVRIVTLEPAGEGNMNVTLRVQVDSPQLGAASVIVKQSRPYVA
ncbi:MAG: hypothetical protein AAGG44_07770, partial [Planctomycetota bacterium]